jgi:CARDB
MRSFISSRSAARRPARPPVPHGPSRRFPAIIAAVAALVLAACGGSEGGNATGSGGSSTPRTGTLAIAIAGLPGGTAASLSISGPGGYSRSVAAAETISGLAPGAYDVTASEVTAGEDRFGTSQPSQQVTIAPGQTVTVSVSYAILTGSISVLANGVPTGAQPDVAITGPAGFSRTVKAGATVGGLTAGTYMLSAASTVVDGHTYAPASPTLEVAVAPSTNPIPASFSYAIASGALSVSLSGLPAGASGTAVVSGPGGFQRTVSSGSTLANLTPGSYTITGETVLVGADEYRVASPRTVQVVPSVVPIATEVLYALATGRLAVTISGLPGGANGAVQVTGPNGYLRSVTASQTISALPPGNYTVSASSVTVGSTTYAPSPASQVVSIAASSTPVTSSVAYAVTTGAIVVTITGLPQAVAASIVISGPGNFRDTVTTTRTVTNLTPGTYTLTANNAVAGTHAYVATPASRTVQVTAGSMPGAAFAYALATGGIALNVTGLPGNVASDITVTGPGGFSRTVTATTLLLGLTAGSYTVTARTVSSAGAHWAPNPATQTITVAPSMSATTAAVNYVTATGGLTVTIGGLAGGVNASVTVTGPNAYSRVVTATTTLTGLLQGLYTATAASVTSSGTTYTPSPTSQNVVVGGGVTSSVAITYTASSSPPPPPAGLNLTIDGMHVQQVVQSYGGTVPLIAGRDGLLRVFVKANGTNSATPAVRVRFYDGTTLTSTVTITAPSSAVPQAITEGTLTSSWNYAVPGSLMQPGLRILADVDPTNTVTESAENDNTYPVSGTPVTMDVRSVSTFSLRFVPVLQSANGLQGGVTAGNAGSYLAQIRALFPLGTIDADVRAAYTTAAPALQSGDGNGAWSQILSEVNALRTADGSTRYYYGVVKVGYSSGIAGLGYVPGRASIGWDFLPSASEVMAHEVGHNFGRFHAPGCGAGSPDGSYPHTDGKIGVYGYDLTGNALRSPSTYYDLMGYCNTNWISDYTYTAILNYRAANPFAAAARFAAGGYARRGLLVWGRVQGGQLILEPAFEVDAPPALPARPGPHRLQGYGPLGQTLFDVSFDGERIADHPDPTAQHFAFVLPLESMRGMSPTRLRAVSRGRQVEFTSSSTATAPGASNASATPTVERLDARRLRIRWDSSTTRGVLVRHPRTGEILAFARGGEAVVYTAESSLDLTTSDGVRSARARVSVGATRGPLR